LFVFHFSPFSANYFLVLVDVPKSTGSACLSQTLDIQFEKVTLIQRVISFLYRKSIQVGDLQGKCNYISTELSIVLLTIRVKPIVLFFLGKTIVVLKNYLK